MARQRHYLEFDGTTTFVSVDEHMAHRINKPLTVEAWIWVDSFVDDYAGIVVKSPDDGSNGGFAIVLGAGKGFFPESSAAYLALLPPPDDAQTGTTGQRSLNAQWWRHIAFVYDGNQTLTLYIDDQVRATATLRRSGQDLQYPSSSDPLLFGKYWTTDLATMAPVPVFFKGRIAEVRLWDVARTQAQIRDDYRCQLRGDEAGLVGYWPLDEGQGSVAKDKSQGQRNGTITGGRWVTSDDQICDGPRIEVTPNPKDFGSQQVGTDGSAQTFTLRNRGKCRLFLKERPTLTGGDASLFELDASGWSLPVTVDPNSSIMFNVAFKPKTGTTDGLKKATVEIKSNDPDYNPPNGSPFKLELQGTATAPSPPVTGGPKVMVLHSTLGSINVVREGETVYDPFPYHQKLGRHAGFAIREASLAILQLKSVQIEPSRGFTILSPPIPAGYTIPANYTANITVGFSPLHAGMHTAEVTIVTDDRVTPYFRFFMSTNA